jgi:hypothetical protein
MRVISNFFCDHHHCGHTLGQALVGGFIAAFGTAALADSASLICDMAGRTLSARADAVIEAAEGVSRCRYSGSGSVERVVLKEREQTLLRIEFTPNGRVKSLQCARRSRVVEDINLCGWAKATEVDLFDDTGRKRGALTHDDGLRIGYKTFAPEGGLQVMQQLLPNGQSELRRFFPNGVLQSVVITQGNKRVSETSYRDNGQTERQVLWDDYQQRSETVWSESGRVALRTTQTLFEGKATVAIEQYWPNGLLRERKMLDSQQQPVGLVQRFAQSGALVQEVLHRDGSATEVFNTSMLEATNQAAGKTESTESVKAGPNGQAGNSR